MERSRLFIAFSVDLHSIKIRIRLASSAAPFLRGVTMKILRARGALHLEDRGEIADDTVYQAAEETALRLPLRPERASSNHVPRNQQSQRESAPVSKTSPPIPPTFFWVKIDRKPQNRRGSPEARGKRSPATGRWAAAPARRGNSTKSHAKARRPPAPTVAPCSGG